MIISYDFLRNQFIGLLQTWHFFMETHRIYHTEKFYLILNIFIIIFWSFSNAQITFECLQPMHSTVLLSKKEIKYFLTLIFFCQTVLQRTNNSLQYQKSMQEIKFPSQIQITFFMWYLKCTVLFCHNKREFLFNWSNLVVFHELLHANLSSC